MKVTVHEAVRELRGQESRQVFATGLGLSMTSVHYYENERRPEARPLYAFMLLAEKRGRPELAKVFRDELARELNARSMAEMEYTLKHLAMDDFKARLEFILENDHPVGAFARTLREAIEAIEEHAPFAATSLLMERLVSTVAKLQESTRLDSR